MNETLDAKTTIRRAFWVATSRMENSIKCPAPASAETREATLDAVAKYYLLRKDAEEVLEEEILRYCDTKIKEVEEYFA